ncbi:MAG: DsbA family protein [Candidatus Campbellbacteria bacterium]|nr:DsbA family protein [Candidatus Campbellbacteria bacterium]
MQENKFLIPLAVLVAGALVAGAVIFRDKTPNTGITPDGEVKEIIIEPLSASDHIFGNPNAPIVMIEFSDIDCPFCQSFDVTMRRIMDTYGKDGKIAWVYRQFPLDSLHPNARVKAESTECVASLSNNETFWKYLGTLFERTDETPADLSTIAAGLGVDKAAFEKCVADGTFKQKVEDNVQAAMAAGGRGTPYTVILTPDGQKTPLGGALPYEQLEQVVKTLLLDQK